MTGSGAGRHGSAGAATRLRWRAEAVALSAVAPVLGRLRPGARRRLGTALGTAFWAIDARHRRAAVRNLSLAYDGAMPPREVRQLALASMRHYVGMMIETAALEFAGPGGPLDRARIGGMDHLQAALRQGRGVVAFSGHLGVWELWPLALGRRGVPVSVIARPLDNPFLNERLVGFRASTGSRVIAMRGALREASAVLRRGGVVCLLIDQRPERTGVPVPFFGCTAFGAGSVAALALRTGAPIVPGFGVIDADGDWRLAVEPEVPVERRGGAKADAARIVADCTAVLERWVRKHPEQWLWTHARLRR